MEFFEIWGGEELCNSVRSCQCPHERLYIKVKGCYVETLFFSIANLEVHMKNNLSIWYLQRMMGRICEWRILSHTLYLEEVHLQHFPWEIATRLLRTGQVQVREGGGNQYLHVDQREDRVREGMFKDDTEVKDSTEEERKEKEIRNETNSA